MNEAYLLKREEWANGAYLSGNRCSDIAVALLFEFDSFANYN